MEGSRSRRAGVARTWALAALVALGVFVWVAIPVVLIQPFKAQEPFGAAVAYELRRKAPAVTLVGAILLLPLLVRLARHVTRWWQWAPLVLLAALGGFPAWFARQNHFEWMFNPLPDPTYAPATLVDFVDARDMVVAVEIGGDAVAWPVRQMAYHHRVQDRVGGCRSSAPIERSVIPLWSGSGRSTGGRSTSGCGGSTTRTSSCGTSRPVRGGSR